MDCIFLMFDFCFYLEFCKENKYFRMKLFFQSGLLARMEVLCYYTVSTQIVLIGKILTTKKGLYSLISRLSMCSKSFQV